MFIHYTCEYAKEAPIHERYKEVRPAGVLTLDFMLGSEEVNLRNKCLVFKAPMYFCYSSPKVLLPSDTQLPKTLHLPQHQQLPRSFSPLSLLIAPVSTL